MIKRYVLQFLYIQFLVYTITTPILIAWGIPISIMSLLGNFIFTPLLTIFLTTSAIVFVTECLALPNSIFINILSWTTIVWEKLLSFGTHTWLFGLSAPGTLVLILVAILAALVLMRIIFKIVSKMLVAFIIALSLFTLLHYTSEYKKVALLESHPYYGKKLFISKKRNALHIVDRGVFARKRSPEKFVNFELTPYILKKYGNIPIEKIEFKKKSQNNYKAVKELSKTFTINETNLA